MAFVNEYISDNDVKKYHVKEAWREISPGFGGKDYFPSQFSWTIDKDRNIYFIPMLSGKEEFSNQTVCALWWDGILLKVKLAKEGGYLNFSNREGAATWSLLDVCKPESFLLSNQEIEKTLKDILIVYQLDGVRHPMSNYVVTFTF